MTGDLTDPMSAACEDWTPLRPDPGVGYCVGDPGSAGRKVRTTRIVAPAGWHDTVVDAVSLPRFDVRAASVRGLMHRARHKPRQDAFALGTHQDALVLAVCDGVGSLALSHEAAQLAASRLPSLLDAHHPSTGIDWAGVIDDLNAELTERRAVARGEDEPTAENDMATTLLAAVVTTDATGAVRAELAWIGDSHAYVLRAGDWMRLTGVSDRGEGGLVEHRGVSALPSRRPAAETVVVELRAGDVLVLTTDGIGDALGDGGGLVGGALLEWWSQPPDYLEFAAQVGFKRKGYMDDRTAVAAWVGEPT